MEKTVQRKDLFEIITELRERVSKLESKVKKLNGRVFSRRTPQEGE